MRIRLSAEVAAALTDAHPVVALESTLLAHGLPAPRNLAVADRLERCVRDAGAVPATVAVLDGSALIGLTHAELERVCDPTEGLAKLSRRDLGVASAAGACGATTVAATAALAADAGIAVFATGGLGGVHRGTQPSWDVSADLEVLAQTPILLVCSGVKSVLDVAATLEVLETHSVPVLGYRTDTVPLFYLRDSPFAVPWRVDDPQDAAIAFAAHRTVPGRAGMVLANPIPAAAEMSTALHAELLDSGFDLLRARGVRGQDVTPVLLEHFHRHSGGASLRANEELVCANAELAAQVALRLATTVAAR
ncbi:MAG: pseudouridine-5'-phosphate glycosidase [Sciscionella sp.]